MTTDLKPCPFCGGEAHQSLDRPPHWDIICCTQCSCETERADWNRRHTPNPWRADAPDDGPPVILYVPPKSYPDQWTHWAPADVLPEPEDDDA